MTELSLPTFGSLFAGAGGGDVSDIQLIHGDCLEVMRAMDENSVDTIITDPPYGLKFMGKEWDNGVPGVPFWEAALRVAKPGAMLLAMGGTRTHHRLMCAIEDAGWEIRDCLNYMHDGSQSKETFWDSLNDDQRQAYLELHCPNQTMFWAYGSGFPKSCSISKNIDKAAGVKRKVVGQRKLNPRDKTAYTPQSESDKLVGLHSSLDITAPATPDAELWDGWGTALKPAYEIIILAMKPLDGTFAENALKWKVAGLNIDGARVGTGSEKWDWDGTRYGESSMPQMGGHQTRPYVQEAIANHEPTKVSKPHSQGRWPANLILGFPEDEYELRDDVTPEQLRQLAGWLDENA